MNVNTTVVRNVYERRVTNLHPGQPDQLQRRTMAAVNLKPNRLRSGCDARAANGTCAGAGSISTRGRGESRAVRRGKSRSSERSCSRVQWRRVRLPLQGNGARDEGEPYA